MVATLRQNARMVLEAIIVKGTLDTLTLQTASAGAAAHTGPSIMYGNRLTHQSLSKAYRNKTICVTYKQHGRPTYDNRATSIQNDMRSCLTCQDPLSAVAMSVCMFTPRSFDIPVCRQFHVNLKRLS